MSDVTYRYIHPVTATPLPSVTEIIDIINKPFLLPWANGLGFKRIRYSKYMDEVADIGTLTHDAFNQILRSTDFGQSLTFPNAINNPLGGFYKFLSKHTLKMEFGELQIYGDRYAGTVDFIGYLDGIPCIIDFKTSKNFSPSMFLQLIGYKNLLRFSPEAVTFNPEELHILKVSRNDSSYLLQQLPRELEAWYTRIFNLCLLLHEEWIMNGACEFHG